ncbi:MAG: hypothetical protein QXW10_00310 [Candidatus Micrarchaeaceae archaeon]
METIVIGLGGNALLNPKGKQSLSSEVIGAKNIAKSIALLSKRFKIILTHGNGSQVGDELLKNVGSIEPLPLYLLNAETQASMGSVLETALNGEKPSRGFCTVVTHTLVSKNDPAFKRPTKPIGPFYTRAQLGKALRHGRFNYIEEHGMFRRVMPSPRPAGILEAAQIKYLLGRFNVICGGGGGIPIYKEKGIFKGANAVIDKDYTTQLIANMVGARRMVILTNVEYVYKDFEDKGSYIKVAKKEELKDTIGSLEEGTIRPKVDACIRFLEGGGKIAQIGSIGRLKEVIMEKSGTTIT